LHPPPPSAETTIIQGLKELSLSFTQKQVQQFVTYLYELKKWNRAYNLTSLKTDKDIIIKHFLDSLLYLKALPEGVVSVLDVGSGAGFPGVPLKIMRPEITLYLLEPSRKKAAFLMQIIRTLGLVNIDVVEQRVENIRTLTVDVAVTRALFDIKEFHKKVSPLVRKGGRLILSKGPKVREELRCAQGIPHELLTFMLPHTSIRRFIVVLKKETPEPSASSGNNPEPSRRDDPTPPIPLC
jgi:16S rRNA (guanine527-N7)-methyltransferase